MALNYPALAGSVCYVLLACNGESFGFMQVKVSNSHEVLHLLMPSPPDESYDG